MFDKILFGFILLLSTIWLPNISQGSLQLLVFNYGTMTLFAVGIILQEKRKFTNYSLPLILSISIVLTLIRTPKCFTVGLLNILFCCMFYYVVVRNTVDISRVLRCFKWLFWFNIPFVILQAMGIQLVYMAPSPAPLICGVMAKNYHLGFLLAIIAPILAGESLLYFVLIGIILLLIKSWAAYLAFITGMMVYLYMRFEKKSIRVSIISGSILLFISGVSMLFYHPVKFNVRFSGWVDTLKDSLKNPVIGNGIGALQVYLDRSMCQLGGVITQYLNNDYLTILFEYGLLFVLAISYFIFRYYSGLIIKKCNDNIPKGLLASITAMLIIPFFHKVMDIPRIAVPMLLILALFEISLLDKKEAV